MTRHKLTNSQLLIVRMAESFQGTNICSNCYELTYDQPLDKIEDAFENVFKKNPILNSRIEKEGGDYYCVLNEDKPKRISIPIVDYGVEEFMKEPLDIFKGEYIKMAARYVDGVLHIFGNTHHIFFDASSGYYFLNAVKAYIEGNADLPDISDYLDYFEEEKEYLDSKRFLADKEFWEELFCERPNPSPISRKEARVIDIDAKRTPFKVDETTMESIRGLKAITNCSVFDIFSAALSLYLGFTSGRADKACFGTTFENRGRKFKQTVGMFVNIMNYQIPIDYSMSARDFIKKIGIMKLSFLRHGSYPYSMVSEYVEKKHHMNKLYHVMLSYQPPKMLGLDSLDDFTWHFSNYVESDCNIHVLDNADDMMLLYDYKTVLFDEDNIRNLHRSLCAIIKHFCENPEGEIGNVDCCPEEDRLTVMNVFNRENGKKDCRQITDIIRGYRKDCPERKAVIYKDKTLTYRELVDEAEVLAKRLVTAGVGKGDVVGVLVDRSEKYIVACLSVLFCGATYVPMDKNHPPKRRQYILDNSEVRYLVVDSYDENHPDTTQIEMDLNETIVDVQLPVIKDPEVISYILYTSGSTGKPKGVKITNANIVNLIMSLKDDVYSSFPEDTVVGLTASFSFDASVQQIYAALLLGYALNIIPESDKKDGISYYRYISENRFDALDMTPSHMQMLIDGNIHECSILGPKTLLVGGEAMRRDVVLEFMDMFSDKTPELYNVYGPTECCVDSTIYKVEADRIRDREIVPIGKSIANMKAYVLNNAMKMVPIGEEGELFVSGYGVGAGYANLPDETAKRFLPDPFTEGNTMYRTGDLVKFLESGDIAYIDRIDNQVKIHGYRIELDEIEQVIYDCESVKQAVVTTEGEGSRKEIVAFIVSDGKCSEADIEETIIAKLPSYMLPKRIIMVDNIPLNQSGKADKKMLLEMYADKASNDAVLPDSDIEKKIYEIWKKVLDRTDFGVLDDFFELGGHSLNLTAMMAGIEKEFGYQLKWNVFYENANIRKLSKVVEDKANSGAMAKTVPFEKAQEKEYYEVSSTQKRMYLAWLMNREDVSNNSPIIMKMDGKLNTDKLIDAVQHITKRHEALRTVFETHEGNIVQKILPRIEIPLTLDNNVNTVGEVIGKAIAPFDLEKGPLIRLYIAQKSADEHIVVIDMHHIITDGESYKIILKEISDFYNDVPLSKVEFQYKDFSEWQRDELCNSEYYRKQGEYWEEQFKEGIPVLKLPYDHYVSGQPSNKGKTINRKLSGRQLKALKKLAKQEDVTLFIILFSMYSILLREIGGNDEFAIAIPIAARTRYELLSVVGYFVNLVPIKISFRDEKLTEFIQRVKETNFGAYGNQDYLFEHIFENSKQQMEDFLKVSFTETKDIDPLQLSGIKTSIVNPEYPISKYDLLMNLVDSDAEAMISLAYRTDLFVDDTMNIIMDKFFDLIDKLAENPDIRIEDLTASDEVQEEALFAF